MTFMKKKETRGGAREGAGRPAGKTRVTIALSISHEANAKLRSIAKKKSASISSVADELFRDL
jgi:hypothetical protein